MILNRLLQVVALIFSALDIAIYNNHPEKVYVAVMAFYLLLLSIYFKIDEMVKE